MADRGPDAASISIKRRIVLFTKNRHVSVQSVRGAAHAITLESSASTFRRKVARWLIKLGF